jgi:hypothetical protein
MLQNPNESVERRWPASRRLLAGLCLLGVAAVVSALHGPVVAAGEDAAGPPRQVAAPTASSASQAALSPFDVRYVIAEAPALVAFRPAATFRRPELAFLSRAFESTALPRLAKECHIDLSQPNFRKLGLEDIEWIMATLSFGREPVKDGRPPHRLMLSNPVIRTAAPFDWLTYLRQWGFDFTEARESGRLYYKVTGRSQYLLGGNPCVYLPDNRTMVAYDEASMRTLLRREPQVEVAPAYLAGPEWDRVSRGLFAIAIQNQNGAFTKTFDLGRPDDTVVLALFQGGDRWVFGMDDADPLVLHAAATCLGDASATLARTIESLVKLARDGLANPAPGGEVAELSDRTRAMLQRLLTNLRIEPSDHGVALRAEGFGTVADLAAMLDSGGDENDDDAP